MKICAPTNFDDELLPQLGTYSVHEVYGKLPSDDVGGGRPSYLLPQIGWPELEQHVALAHRHDIRFNYLLNAVTMGGRETTRDGYRRIRRLLDRIARAGADAITVANPLILQLARKTHPHLEVKVSAFAGVCTPLQARLWSEAGADVLTPQPTAVNREFAVLEAMAEAFAGEIQLVANNNCIQGCAYYPVHAALHAQASQRGHWSRGFVIDYCLMGCRTMRLENPGLFIKGDWIRPEDLEVYARFGVDQIKVVNRSSPTPVILQRVAAYAGGEYEGNLLDIVEQAQDHRDVSGRSTSAWQMARTFLRPGLVNPARLTRLSELSLKGEPIAEIPNAQLDGFIDHFVDNSCLTTDCGGCGYCDEVAERVVRVREPRFGTLRERYREALDDFVAGRFFRWR